MNRVRYAAIASLAFAAALFAWCRSTPSPSEPPEDADKPVAAAGTSGGGLGQLFQGRTWSAAADASLEGTVLDAATGKPVANVEVVFRAGGFGEVSAVSDESGRYATSLPPGRYRVLAYGDGVYGLDAAPLVLLPVGRTTRRDVLVQRSAHLEGKVVDARRRPVANATVEFSVQRGRFELRSRDLDEVLPTGVSAVTDGSGQFAFEVLAGEVTVTAETDSAHGEAKVVVAGGKSYQVTIVTEALAELAGTVQGPDGSGVAGATISAIVFQGAARVDDKTVTSGEGGRFEVKVRAGERAILEARADGHGQSAPVHTKAVSGRRTAGLTLALQTAAAISGLVKTVDGTPVAGAKVAAYMPGSKMNNSVTTDSDGRFVLDGLGAGPFHVVAHKTGYAAGRADKVAAPARDLRLVMVNARGIRGVVQSSTGQPVSEFAVRVERFTSSVDGQTRSGSEPAASFRDVNGRFEIPVVEPGTYELEVSAPGFAPVVVGGVDVPAGGDGKAQVQLEAAGGVISGVVLSAADSRPVAGARIELDSGYFGGAVVTDESGRFRLERVRDGLRSVRASHHDFGTVIAPPVHVASGRDVAVELSLEPTGGTDTVQLSGIGAIVDVVGGKLIVSRPVPGGAAARAGLRRNDRIVAIDGVSSSGVGFSEAVERIRGPARTRVTLTVERDGRTLELQVIRSRLTAPRPARGTLALLPCDGHRLCGLRAA
jgi:protocatechuate 3,4-dioxygenase beta subunit